MAKDVRKRADTPGPDGFHREKAELLAVLESAAFSRTPTLSKFLSYVCWRHFQGRQDQIKEYSIAVEALGRPVEFSPEKDSVVRVEAYRLRKQLRRYYETEGAGRPLKIAIPRGHYLPTFVPHAAGKAPVKPETMHAEGHSAGGGARDPAPGGQETSSSPDKAASPSRRLVRSAVAGGAALVLGVLLA